MIGGQLIVEIADRANLQSLRQKLGCAPVEMPVDSILITGALGPNVFGINDARQASRPRADASP